jgi:hypothetical protein
VAGQEISSVGLSHFSSGAFSSCQQKNEDIFPQDVRLDAHAQDRSTFAALAQNPGKVHGQIDGLIAPTDDLGEKIIGALAQAMSRLFAMPASMADVKLVLQKL